ncbi:M56 family metallopeptidase [Sphingomonas sp.]|uniref:M56 family metallopeptidase n=1 Tax=Sphingomonas sp. TaxID=28214 RepID=UPI002D7F7EDD|nr:M56 family metallopeptidase [Sphingomonas sp.]HEU0044423.1 M56 family metallopeptidase [Sphingomonas sp.]
MIGSVGFGSAAWLIDALIASALLMAAVLVARGPIRRAFGPQVAYALWALPLLRLLMPPLPAGWWQTATTPISRAGETIATVFVFETAAPATSAAPVAALPLGTVLAFAWAAGAAAFLVWHLVRHARFCGAIVRTAEQVEDRDGIRVIASPVAPGPLAFGIWRRYVAFPRDFTDRYDADERALALAHELGHHARRDLLANWAGLVVLALHWFNPLAWRAFHAFRADQELANDARVLAGCAPADRHAYGRAIVKAAHGGAVSAACHLHTISDLKGRLRMLTVSRASRRRLAAGSAAVTLLVAGGLGLTASSSAAEQIRERLDLPLPALAPIAPPATTPVVAAAVQLPPVPPMPKVSNARRKHVVVVKKDGKTETFEGADADKYLAEHDLPLPPLPPHVLRGPTPPLPPHAPSVFRSEKGKDGKYQVWVPRNIPEVTSTRCPGNASKPVVENHNKDGRQRIVICTNRIDAMARSAERLALQDVRVEQHAMMSARTGLAMARAAIERDRNLSDEQREQALEGIAQAEAEVRAH